MVEECNRLRLTKEEDRLPVLSGLAKSNQSVYLAGIWLQHFPHCLYWAPDPYYTSHRAPIDLDEDFNRSLRQEGALNSAEALNARCEVQGVNPHGRVKSGFLVINGWTGTAAVSKIHRRRMDASGMSGFSQLSGIELQEDSVGPYRASVLVLKASATVPGSYERVGLIFPATQVRYISNDDDNYDILVGDIFKSAPNWFDEEKTVRII
ncbi:uncharacterized protein BDZ99DRAFT_572712 [Mytilinidion resinicola]|uniref:Heterokaryon incompatibility domain-containing protein n=1 Tax=Mytilinidion resinicola TaxID=574789 RepID=A0A6A6YIR6_9PEZI|nr:uncharacterized protein BDZ99DRAFT_572712 [Mytilinidion resinicola]KAF2807817.1 hypothetical protein BDZ99DRAFT_572712 [Mytilinidion resinicola]